MKPTTNLAKIKVVKKSGGVWKFKIKIVATLPDVDDLIYIRSPLN